MADLKIAVLRMLLFWFCFIAMQVAAQAQSIDDITFERLPIPGSIRSAQVLDVTQDGTGFMWLAGDGLYRYDGFRFTSYRDIEKSESVLNSKETNCLFFDSARHRIIVGTRTLGVVVYDYHTDRLHRLPCENKIPILNQLAATSDGEVYAVSERSGLHRLQNDTLRRYLVKGLSTLPVSVILPQGRTLFAAQLAHIYQIENGVMRDSIDLNDAQGGLPSYTKVSCLAFDRQHQLWIGTEKQGVFVYDLIAKKFVRYFGPTQAPFYSRINRIYQDRAGMVWMLTKASGLALFDPRTEKLIKYKLDPFNPGSISGDNCFSIAEDRSGIIWIGSTGDLNKYDRQKIKVQHIRNNPTEKISLSDNMVRGVYQDRSGKLWIGTDGGFINIIDRQANTIEKIRIRMPGDTANYVPVYFLELNERYMLIASSLGLLQMDRAAKTFAPFAPTWKLTRGKMVRQLIRKNDDLYFIFGGSFFVYNLKTGKQFRHQYFGSPEASNVTVMYLDKKERLWAGVNGGLSYVDQKTMKFKYIPFEKIPARPDSTNLMVLSIEQFQENIYSGTFNAGFWKIDISNPDSIPPPKSFTEKDGLPSNTVYASLSDEVGNLWLSTNNGLAKFLPKSNQVYSFAISEGLQGEEFNRLAYFKNSDGEMILGGINGVNIFHPLNLSVAVDNFVPEISSIDVFDPFSPDKSSRIVLPRKEDIKLTHEQNFLTFNFFIPTYRTPKRFKTFYRLLPFDKTWKEAIYENQVVYPNLKSGTYTFSVRTQSVEGIQKESSVQVVIALPIWKTWWFIVLSICVIAFLVLTIIRSYVRKAQFDKERLERLLYVRTQEIEKSHEELMGLNQKKDLIFSILSHDLRSPLTTLKGFLGILIESVDFLSKEDIRRHAMSIRHSVTNSLDLIDNTLFWSLSQMGNIQYSPTTFNLKPVIAKITGLYQLTAEKKKISVSTDCDEPLMIFGDENMVYVILRNIVSNAIKFTPEGKSVFIHCYRKGLTAEIKVRDEGVGMSAEYLQKVLSLDQPLLKKGTSNEKGTGLGLLLCKNFLEMNRGKLHIESVEHAGTTFTVTLPLADPTN